MDIPDDPGVRGIGIPDDSRTTDFEIAMFDRGKNRMRVLLLVATLAVVPVSAQVQQRPDNPPPQPRAEAISPPAQTPGPASTLQAEQLLGVRSRNVSQALVQLLGPQATEPTVQIASVPNETHPNAKLASKYDVSRIGNRNIGDGRNFYSLEAEQRLGHELSSELEDYVPLITDPQVTEFVSRVGQRLTRNSDAKIPLTIKVIDSEEINAFALPGGYLYVNSGLILAVQNEAELAGVMAHEIAHVAARHATRNLTRSRIWSIASIPLIFIGGPAGVALRQVIALGVPLSSLKFSRDQEREADLLGLEYEYAAGYDPLAIIQLFERLHGNDRKPSFLLRAFATHPLTEDRLKRAQETISTFLPPRDHYVITTNEFEEIKGRLVEMRGNRLSDPSDPTKPTLRRHRNEDN